MSTHWCFACDKEMRFAQSVVQVEGYITCGASACKRKAVKCARAIYSETPVSVKKAEGVTPVLIVVYSTKTPLKEDSWKIVPPCDHPAFLQDPAVLAIMLNEGKQAQDADDPDTWYHVERTADAREKLEKARPH